MAHHTELAELVHAAIEAISQTLLDGDEKGYVGAWRQPEWTDIHHIDHAFRHVDDLYNQINDTTIARLENLNHAITRLAMLRANILRREADRQIAESEQLP